MSAPAVERRSAHAGALLPAGMAKQPRQEADRSVHTRASLSRRAFLTRGIAVAGGAVALPVLGPEPARCSERATGGVPPSPNSATITSVNQGDLKAVTDSIMCEGGCGMDFPRNGRQP